MGVAIAALGGQGVAETYLPPRMHHANRLAGGQAEEEEYEGPYHWQKDYSMPGLKSLSNKSDICPALRV